MTFNTLVFQNSKGYPENIPVINLHCPYEPIQGTNKFASCKNTSFEL